MQFSACLWKVPVEIDGVRLSRVRIELHATYDLKTCRLKSEGEPSASRKQVKYTGSPPQAKTSELLISYSTTG